MAESKKLVDRDDLELALGIILWTVLGGTAMIIAAAGIGLATVVFRVLAG